MSLSSNLGIPGIFGTGHSVPVVGCFNQEIKFKAFVWSALALILLVSGGIADTLKIGHIGFANLLHENFHEKKP